MRYLNNKYIGVMQVVIITTLFFSVQSFAGNSWFNKGSDFFKSLGGADKAKALTVEEINAVSYYISMMK